MVDNDKNSARDIYSQYLLFSDESVLINNAIANIKQNIKIDEAFDFEVISLQECEYNEIINKILTPPFISQKRMIVLKNLEKVNTSELKEFALMLPKVPSFCCLIMVYMAEKKWSKRQTDENFKKICEIFPDAHAVALFPNENTIYRWVVKKLEVLGLSDRHDLAEYLVEEFAEDINGMKNEIQKIANYLFQTKQLGISDLKEILGGIIEYDAYQVARNFFNRHREAIKQLVNLETHLKTPMILIDALGRILCNYAQETNDIKIIRHIANQLARIDNRLKTGTDFGGLLLEVFFIKNLRDSSKGVIYG